MTNSARQRAFVRTAIGTNCHARSPSRRCKSRHASASCPSVKQSASTFTVSPATRLIANRPPSTAGATFSITTRMRPSAGSDDGCIEPPVFLLLNGCWLQEQYRKRRQRQGERVRTALRRHRRGLDAAQVADAAAAVNARIAIQALAPKAAVRRTDNVVVARNRREVAYNDQRSPRPRFAQKAQHARLGIVVVDP